MTNSVQWLILAGRAARSFAIGAFVVAVPLALVEDGLSVLQSNIVLSAGLAGATVQLQFNSSLSRRLGRLVSLAIYTVLLAGAGGVLAASSSFYVAVVAAFLGAVSLQPNISVQAPLEQASLADSATGEDRTKIFAWYNGVSTIAIAAGSFAAGLPLAWGSHYQIALTSLLLFVAAMAYMSPRGNQSAGTAKETLLVPDDLPLAQCRHRRRIVGLAFLFGVDAFAGGMTMNAFLIQWLVSQYHMTESILGTLFGVCSVVTTPSLWVAAWLGNKVGLVNTMVFTHLPANLGLVILPFAPNVTSVCIVLLFRALLSQMDVPARDAFMMTVVDQNERVSCSSFINTARGLSCVLGPPVAAIMWEAYGSDVPLIVAGLLKCAYDITLLFTFRAVQSADATNSSG